MKISLRSWWDRRFHRNKQKPCLFLHSFDNRMIISCRPAICSCLSTKMLVFLTTRRCALLSLHTSKTILHFRYLFVFHQFYLIILIFSEGALGHSFAPKSKCNKCRCVMGYSPVGMGAAKTNSKKTYPQIIPPSPFGTMRWQRRPSSSSTPRQMRWACWRTWCDRNKFCYFASVCAATRHNFLLDYFLFLLRAVKRNREKKKEKRKNNYIRPFFCVCLAPRWRRQWATQHTHIYLISWTHVRFCTVCS